MRCLIYLAALLLAGCWEGDRLYSIGDARQPIPAGTYRLTAADGETGIEQISLLASGLTQLGDKDRKHLYGFVPIDGQNRRFVVWAYHDKEAGGERSQLYLLLERRSNDEFALYMPRCIGDEAEIARRAGAVIENGTVSVCKFPTRASLESALRQIGASNDTMKIVRVREK
jgi:hypothetical protein